MKDKEPNAPKSEATSVGTAAAPLPSKVAAKVSELWEVTDAKNVLIRSDTDPRYELLITLKPKSPAFTEFGKGDVVSLDRVLGQ